MQSLFLTAMVLASEVGSSDLWLEILCRHIAAHKLMDTEAL